MEAAAAQNKTASSTAPHSAVLHKLIDRSLEEFHIEYGGGLANHTLHALVALVKLGADEARLKAYFDEYTSRLEPAKKRDEKLKIEAWNWRTWIGKREHFLEYVDFFEAEIKRTSAQETVATYLPPLASGFPTGAFHPVIQLGYAIEAGHTKAIASGLAWLSHSYIDYGTLPAVASDASESAVEILDQVRTDPEFDGVSKIRDVGFGSAMYYLAAYKHKVLEHYVSKWSCKIERPEDVDIIYRTLCKSAVTMYHNAGNDDFFLLHTVTALHALKRLLEFFPKTDADTLALKQTLLRYYFMGALYAYVAQGRPCLSPKEHEHLPSIPTDWASLSARAIPYMDEHVIKIVAACREEDEEERARDATAFDASQPSSDNMPSMYVLAAAITLEKVQSGDDWEFKGIGNKLQNDPKDRC